MPEAALRVLVPGTLCDAQLFEGLCAHWPAGVATQVLSVHALQPLVTWWPTQMQDWPAQVDLLGFSLGAILALGLLALAPERVRRLVLVAGNPTTCSAEQAQRVASQHALWQRSGPRAVAREMATQASPSGALSAAALTTLEAMATRTTWAGFQAQGRLNLERADGARALAAWRGPVLLASGAQDPWCGDDKQGLMRQARPDARWLRLEGAGHYLPLERPRELAEATQDFFSNNHLQGGTP